jgi:adenine-specific DNA methylase
MTERRLIEEWLPIAEIGIESLRERRANDLDSVPLGTNALDL